MSVLFRGARFNSKTCSFCSASLFVYGEKYNTVGDHGTITDYY